MFISFYFYSYVVLSIDIFISHWYYWGTTLQGPGETAVKIKHVDNKSWWMDRQIERSHYIANYIYLMINIANYIYIYVYRYANCIDLHLHLYLFIYTVCCNQESHPPNVQHSHVLGKARCLETCGGMKCFFVAISATITIPKYIYMYYHE